MFTKPAAIVAALIAFAIPGARGAWAAEPPIPDAAGVAVALGAVESEHALLELADPLATEIASATREAEREGHGFKLSIVDLDEAGGGGIRASISERFRSTVDLLTRKILMKATPESVGKVFPGKRRIEDLNLGQRVHYFRSTPKYRKNFVFALVRGAFNGGVSSITFVFSSLALSPVAVLPNALAIFLMSGGLQIFVDLDHAWLTNGGISSRLMFGKNFERLAEALPDASGMSEDELRRLKSDPEALVRKVPAFGLWKKREFYARWFASQLTFMGVIDLSLIATGVFTGQAFTFILVKTVINSVFAMLSEGAFESVAKRGADLWRESRAREIDEDGSLSEAQKAELKAKAIDRSDTARHSLVAGGAILSTAAGALRNAAGDSLWSVFIPTDAAGAVLVGLGAASWAASKVLDRWEARHEARDHRGGEASAVLIPNVSRRPLHAF